MEFTLKSYNANSSDLHDSSNDRCWLSRKNQEAPTTSLLGMMGTIVVPTREDESPAAVSQSIMDSPARVSQPISLVTPLYEPFDEELYSAKSPMQDSTAGEFYEHATWKMYQRIQSARKDMIASTTPLHINATSTDHFLPTQDQLTNERPFGGRRKRLQPRNSSITTNFVTSSTTGSDWSFLHFDIEDNEENTATEISSCDDTDDDPIFDMDDL